MPTRDRLNIACAAALAAGALLAAGCGGGGSPRPRRTSALAPPTAAKSNRVAPAATARPPTAATARPPTAATARPPTRHKPGTATRGRGGILAVKPKANEHYATAKITRGSRVQTGNTKGSPRDDAPARGASPGAPSVAGLPNPCRLVTAAQAQIYTGRRLTISEAPLGPTCIYQEAGPKAVTVTVAVSAVSFASLKRHLHRVSRFKVGGRSVYCGVFGTSVTYLPLPGGRVMSVTEAPCAVGLKFAAAALPRLS